MENKKSKTAKNTHTGKREFIKTAIAGAGLAALGLNPFQEAFAWSYDDLPPGFRPETCNDKNLINLFAIMYMRPTGYREDYVKQALLRKGMARDDWQNVYNSVKEDTPLTEPAYWFATDYFNFKFRRGDIIDFKIDLKKFHPKENSNMWNWLKGNGSYFSTWVDSSWGGKAKDVELYLTKAIVGSAGLRGRDGELRKAIRDLDKDAEILKAIQRGLGEAGVVDRKIAGWSGFLMSENSYNLEKRIEEGSTTRYIYNYLEVPPARILKVNFRGPPYYYIGS